MFFKQADEERAPGLKFVDYIDDVGGAVDPGRAGADADLRVGREAVKQALDRETEVTNRVNAMMTLAVEQKDYAAQDFLRWFVTEQVEEMATMDNLLKVVRCPVNAR